MNEGARQCENTRRRDTWHDTRNALALHDRTRRHDDDRLAAGETRTNAEGDLTAGAAVHARADRFARDLAGQVDAERVVDRDEALFARDEPDVVGDIEVVELKTGIAVSVIEFLAPKPRRESAAHHDARKKLLVLARHPALPDEAGAAPRDDPRLHGQVRMGVQGNPDKAGERSRAAPHRWTVGSE